jgi:hypothetical protein
MSAYEITVAQVARLFDVPLEYLDPVFAVELREVRAINAALPFADPIALVES